MRAPAQECLQDKYRQGSTPKVVGPSGLQSGIVQQPREIFVNRFSDTRTPPLITLHDATGKELRVLEDNGQLAAQLAAAQLPQKEFITVPAADGITQLNGWIIKPVRFDASRKYPVVMIQYSGPNSQQVLDRFERTGIMPWQTKALWSRRSTDGVPVHGVRRSESRPT